MYVSSISPWIWAATFPHITAQTLYGLWCSIASACLIMLTSLCKIKLQSGNVMNCVFVCLFLNTIKPHHDLNFKLIKTDSSALYPFKCTWGITSGELTDRGASIPLRRTEVLRGLLSALTRSGKSAFVDLFYDEWLCQISHEERYF